jgi:hypothetical protein
MKTYSLKAVGSDIRLYFMNFGQEPKRYGLVPDDGADGMAISVYLCEGIRESLLKKVEEGKAPGNVVRTKKGLLCEFFDHERERIYLFFEPGLPLSYVVDRGINQALQVFQEELDAIILHAASVVIEDRAYLFTAPSGGGKSTISRLAGSKGFKVMGDDLCVVRREDGRFFARVYPCSGAFNDESETKEVGGVFLLDKSRSNRVRQLKASEAVSRIMPEATSLYKGYLTPDRRKFYRKHVFEFLNSMLGKFGFKSLSFNKENTEVFSWLG